MRRAGHAAGRRRPGACLSRSCRSIEKTVILRGNTANPGRFAWHPGMRVSDLIPDKDSLITRNYWWKRAQLGLPAPEFEPVPGFDNLRQPAGESRAHHRSNCRGQRERTGSNTASKAQSRIQRTSPVQNLSGASGNAIRRGAEPSERAAARRQRNPGRGAILCFSQMLPPRRTEIKVACAPEIDWDYAVSNGSTRRP